MDALLARARSLPVVQQRAVAAVLGACVADAASRPLHWVYDTDKLESIIAGSDAAFFSPSACPFYTLSTGSNSCYHDQMLVGLQALSQEPTVPIDPAHFKACMTVLSVCVCLLTSSLWLVQFFWPDDGG
jgi:hypothetical protein